MNSILAAILNGGILGALVAAAVWVGLRAVPRRALNASARYLVWWAALAAVVMLPLAFLRVVPPIRTSGASGRAANLARNIQAGRQAATQVPDRSLFEDAGVPSQVRERSSGLAFPLVVSAGAAWQWILTAWGAISAILLIRLTVSCILLERRKTRAIAAPPQLTAQIEAWLARRGGGRRHVRLACSPEIGSPMLAGLRRPAILIPERLIAELEEGELEQIGLHEAAHLVRRDDYALLAQRIVEALFAFHLVVRWITRQIDLEREIACDDVVVETIGLPRCYAACLTRMVELCGGVRAGVGESWAGTPAAGARSHLAKRVDRLLDGNRRAGTRHGKTRLAVAIGIVAGVALTAARAPGVIALAMPMVEAVEPVTLAPDISPAADPQSQAATPASPPQQAAATVSPSTVVAVTVQDPMNRFVAGLGKENFKVFEDGLEQEISEFSNENVPISAGIVLDASGSMRDKLDQSRAVTAQFLNAASLQDEFFLVRVKESPELVAAFTGDAWQIQNQLNLVQAGGGTALRDGIRRAIEEMKNARNPSRVLLVITEGEDNSSSISQEDLRNAARAANVQIYAFTFAALGASASRGSGLLRDIAEQSGGQQFAMDGLATQPGAAASVAVRNVYLLGYKSTNATQDGKYRSLRVEAAPPRGLPPLKINYRAGYYAPAR
jgi:Ca-activated chloride channel family protein